MPTLDPRPKSQDTDMGRNKRPLGSKCKMIFSPNRWMHLESGRNFCAAFLFVVENLLLFWNVVLRYSTYDFQCDTGSYTTLPSGNAYPSLQSEPCFPKQASGVQWFTVAKSGSKVFMIQTRPPAFPQNPLRGSAIVRLVLSHWRTSAHLNLQLKKSVNSLLSWKKTPGHVRILLGVYSSF